MEASAATEETVDLDRMDLMDRMALMDPLDPMDPMDPLDLPDLRDQEHHQTAAQDLPEAQAPLAAPEHPEPLEHLPLAVELEADSEVTHRLAVPEIGAPLPMAATRHAETLVSMAHPPLVSPAQVATQHPEPQPLAHTITTTTANTQVHGH